MLIFPGLRLTKNEVNEPSVISEFEVTLTTTNTYTAVTITNLTPDEGLNQAFALMSSTQKAVLERNSSYAQVLKNVEIVFFN